MRHGPVHTASLWDPARPERLTDRLDEVAAGTSLPVTTEAGDLAGCAHLRVWAGDLGLGLPDDPAGAWAELGTQLGELVLAVRPVLALTATEWGAEGLLDPDLGLLRPGLTCGWVRTEDLDDARRERFELLAERGTVRPFGGGLTWAAEGTVALDGQKAGEQGEIAEQVFRAWTGLSGEDAGTTTRLVLGVPPDVEQDQVRSALPAGYEVVGMAGGLAVAWPPTWARTGTTVSTHLPEAGVLLDAKWGYVEATRHGQRSPLALWVPASRPEVLDELGALLAGASRSTDQAGTLLMADETSPMRAAVERLRRDRG